MLSGNTSISGRTPVIFRISNLQKRASARPRGKGFSAACSCGQFWIAYVFCKINGFHFHFDPKIKEAGFLNDNHGALTSEGDLDECTLAIEGQAELQSVVKRGRASSVGSQKQDVQEHR